jgi:predicted HTH domain antitoxin
MKRKDWKTNILLTRGLQAVVQAGIYRSEEEALSEAISTLFAVKPALRQEAAIELFKSGEISLSRAAEMAGLTRWRFQDVLAQRHIGIETDADSRDELEEQVTDMRRYR